MQPIELEIWKPKEDDPRYAERVGQRTAEEVFRELEQRLDSMGMLPDEYFMLDRDWQSGKLIPEGADVFVTTDYGESEGIFLDGYLQDRAKPSALVRRAPQQGEARPHPYGRLLHRSQGGLPHQRGYPKGQVRVRAAALRAGSHLCVQAADGVPQHAAGGSRGTDARSH